MQSMRLVLQFNYIFYSSKLSSLVGATAVNGSAYITTEGGTFGIYLEPERGMGRGMAAKAPSSTKLTSVRLVASNSGEQPHVTAVASDWPFLDLAYSITFAPL